MKIREDNLANFILNQQRSLTLLLATGFLLSPSAMAEITVGVYAGQSFIDNGDLNLTQGNTNLGAFDQKLVLSQLLP